jgi:hypothetical protein
MIFSNFVIQIAILVILFGTALPGWTLLAPSTPRASNDLPAVPKAPARQRLHVCAWPERWGMLSSAVQDESQWSNHRGAEMRINCIKKKSINLYSYPTIHLSFWKRWLANTAMTSGYVAIALYEFDPRNGGFTRYNNPPESAKVLNESQPTRTESRRLSYHSQPYKGSVHQGNSCVINDPEDYKTSDV